ncbi:MAG: hypothetical protein HQK54_12130 [Oligoflexales bacterium]|nr:hypothetical protein [Oligoflexales bacterium]
MSDVKKISNKLEQIIKDAALSRLKYLSNRNDLKLTQLKSTDVISDEKWIILIMVFSTTLKIQFKVFFSHASLKPFLEKNEDLREFSEDVTIYEDFIKEYCNMVSGAVKQALELSEGEMALNDRTRYKLSLPQAVNPSEVHSAEDTAANIEIANFQSFFEFRIADSFIRVATVVTINDISKISRLTQIDLNNILVSNRGDIDFLGEPPEKFTNVS